MNDEPIKYLFSLSFDSRMGLTFVFTFRRTFYRWHWRRFWVVEILWETA